MRRRTLLASALIAAPALVRAAARPIGWVSVEQPAASGETLVATHLPFPSVGRVAVAGDAFRFVPVVWDF